MLLDGEAKRLREAVDRVIDHCDATGEPPTAYVLRSVGGLTEADISMARDFPDLADEAARLDDYRTFYWVRKGVGDPRLATFAAFNLRQPENGGYSDKGAGSGPVRLRIITDGVGEGAFL